jgi:thymidylate synthase (FAD)
MSINNSKDQEILDMRSASSVTYRATVPAVEDILYQPFKALDHGFIRVIDYMGDDNAIVQAARVSYGKGTKKVNEDRGLINYLMRHHHTTPFEMCEIKFHIKLPIFIARQWIRHRTANVNEYSGRYSILDKEFYIPDQANLAAQSSSNMQGRSDEELNAQESLRVLDILRSDAERCYRNYQKMLNLDEEGNVLDENKQGLTRELARMNLNLNFYTQWYWKVDLHNLLHFLRLRVDSHAQYEIRVYAEIMLDIVKKWVPLTYDAFMDYRVNAISLSGKAKEVVKAMIRGEKQTPESSGLSKREWTELMLSLDLNP